MPPQATPNLIPIDIQYPNATYPEGEIQPYTLNTCAYRPSSLEKKQLDLANSTLYQDLRRAASVHKQVRSLAKKFIQPGMSMIEICEYIENCTRTLSNSPSQLNAGIAFPTGCSLNNCAAHYTPNPNDARVLGVNDVCKIDFGTHHNGRIIDSAFTVSFSPEFDPLLLAVREATDAGIRASGIDALLGEIGAEIQETMESHEIRIKNTTYPVKSIRNLSGHSIEQFRIHGANTVPIVKTASTKRMQENECYAIETFGSTGQGYVSEKSDCSHYMKRFDAPATTAHPKAQALLDAIGKNFGTLAFCKRYLARAGVEKYHINLNHLCNEGIVDAYPPLSDVPGSYTAQYEHTLFLRPTCKEVLSRGEDY